MDIAEQLLPCPFCGGEDFRQGESPSGLHWVYCWQCYINKHSYDKKTAIEHWNRRESLRGKRQGTAPCSPPPPRSAKE